MKSPHIFALLILLISLSATKAAMAAESSKAHYLAGGLIVDVAPYGVEKWDVAIFSKITLFRQNPIAFSVRPAFLAYPHTLLFRLPVTMDLYIAEHGQHKVPLILYLGMGAASLNTAEYRILPAFSGGMDIALGNHILLACGINVIMRSTDTDSEMLIGLGFRF